MLVHIIGVRYRMYAVLNMSLPPQMIMYFKNKRTTVCHLGEQKYPS